MNWTGGRLQRHSRGNNRTVIQKQRQHFAKLRTRLQRTPSSNATNFTPSFFKDQTRLEDYTQTRSLATRLAALSGRPSAPKPQEHLETRPDASHPRGDQRYRPASQYQELRKTPSTPLIGTQQPRKKRQRSVQDDELVLLEAKRMQLLKQPDWVGLDLSRPLRALQPDLGKELLGRRRKSNKTKKLQQRIGNNFMGLPSIENIDSARLRFDEISVRIGTAALATQSLHEPTLQHLSEGSTQAGAIDGTAAAEIGVDMPETPTAHSYFILNQIEQEDVIDDTSQADCDQSDSMLLDAEAVLNDLDHDFHQAEESSANGKDHHKAQLGREMSVDAPVERLPDSPESHFRRAFQHSSSLLPHLPSQTQAAVVDCRATSRTVERSPDPRSGRYSAQAATGVVDQQSVPAGIPCQTRLVSSKESAREPWQAFFSLNNQQSSNTSKTGYLGVPGFGGVAQSTASENAKSVSNSASATNVLTQGSSVSDECHQIKNVVDRSPAAAVIVRARRPDGEDIWRQFVFGGLDDEDGDDDDQEPSPSLRKLNERLARRSRKSSESGYPEPTMRGSSNARFTRETQPDEFDAAFPGDLFAAQSPQTSQARMLSGSDSQMSRCKSSSPEPGVSSQDLVAPATETISGTDMSTVQLYIDMHGRESLTSIVPSSYREVDQSQMAPNKFANFHVAPKGSRTSLIVEASSQPGRQRKSANNPKFLTDTKAGQNMMKQVERFKQLKRPVSRLKKPHPTNMGSKDNADSASIYDLPVSDTSWNR